jgi:hypothetical protein
MEPSTFLGVAFAVLAVLVAASFPVGLYVAERKLGTDLGRATRAAAVAAVCTALWLALPGLAAANGALGFAGTPPTMALLILAVLGIALGLGLSRVGGRLATGLPLAALVGVHAFRFPLELMMHRAYDEGLMPVQMSYSGLNFDIVTGITAMAVTGLLVVGRMPLRGVRFWNWMGFGLLLNVMIIANLSTPSPFRVFTNEPANVWVTRAPFVWLPAVMVLLALLGHVVLFRRLRVEAERRSAILSPRSDRSPSSRPAARRQTA